MKQRRVDVGRRARADIERIAQRIKHFGSPMSAERYGLRMFEAAMRLDIATERGIDRGDILIWAPGYCLRGKCGIRREGL